MAVAELWVLSGLDEKRREFWLACDTREEAEDQLAHERDHCGATALKVRRFVEGLPLPSEGEGRPAVRMCEIAPEVPCGCIPKSGGHWCAHSIARAKLDAPSPSEATPKQALDGLFNAAVAGVGGTRAAALFNIVSAALQRTTEAPPEHKCRECGMALEYIGKRRWRCPVAECPNCEIRYADGPPRQATESKSEVSGG